jgi:hypothetical protein
VTQFKKPHGEIDKVPYLVLMIINLFVKIEESSMITTGQWLSIFGIVAEAVGLILLIWKSPTREDVRNLAWKYATAPLSVEPKVSETRRGQALIAIPVFVGLILQMLGVIFP